MLLSCHLLCNMSSLIDETHTQKDLIFMVSKISTGYSHSTILEVFFSLLNRNHEVGLSCYVTGGGGPSMFKYDAHSALLEVFIVALLVFLYISLRWQINILILNAFTWHLSSKLECLRVFIIIATFSPMETQLMKNNNWFAEPPLLYDSLIHNRCNTI